MFYVILAVFWSEIRRYIRIGWAVVMLLIQLTTLEHEMDTSSHSRPTVKGLSKSGAPALVQSEP
jgi:hypothetical protein